MRNSHRSLPCIERLEERAVPTVFGIPWADTDHLSVSFVPDGTNVNGAPSSLNDLMSRSGIATNDWQRVMLKAFQAWTAVSNVELDVVPDDGSPLGSDGPSQGDTRFGDIRIAARPLSMDVLAITTPPGNLGGTASGDIIVNSNYLFGGGASARDLLTVMLQETGHSLGISNNPATDSVMYTTYVTAKSTLSAGDVSAIQTLYGVRQADSLEGGGNNLIDKATSVDVSAYNWQFDASLGGVSGTDTDFFKIKVKDDVPVFTLYLSTSNLSLLEGKVTVYDRNKSVIASATANGSSQDLNVVVAGLTGDAYISVQPAAGTPFATGAYRLRYVSNVLSDTEKFVKNKPKSIDDQANDKIGSATHLDTPNGYAAKTHYQARSDFSSAADVDFYRFRSRKVAAGQLNVMTVTVTTDSKVTPAIAVYNAAKQQVGVTVLSQGSGSMTLQVATAESDSDYYVAVTARGTGVAGTGYSFSAHFSDQVASLSTELDGTLTSATPEIWNAVSVGQTDVRKFSLTTAGAANTGLRMTIYNQSGLVVRQASIDGYADPILCTRGDQEVHGRGGSWRSIWSALTTRSGPRCWT